MCFEEVDDTIDKLFYRPCLIEAEYDNGPALLHAYALTTSITVSTSLSVSSGKRGKETQWSAMCLITARVLSVMALSTALGSTSQVSARESTNTGLAPVYEIPDALAMK